MLEAKTFTIKKSTNKSGQVVNFIPEMVDGKEVYSILNQNNEHCGYMTEDMLNIILKMNEKAVRNSIITNGDFNKVDEINDSVCEFVSLDGKDNKILNGYNSVDRGENNNISQTINELEIL